MVVKCLPDLIDFESEEPSAVLSSKSLTLWAKYEPKNCVLLWEDSQVFKKAEVKLEVVISAFFRAKYPCYCFLVSYCFLYFQYLELYD